ncbi:MAG: hypothetical protein QOF05_993 [Sphingomonadales bacterium]|jgi:hypothetical protein|nr:hypothetical protein [Sphingomonadales bacterium]
MRAIPVVVGLTAIVGLVDAAGAQGAARNKLFVEGDVVRGAQQGAPGPFCVLSNQFKRLEKVVWRIRVLDEAGQSLDNNGLKSVIVELPDGQKLNAKFDRHPPPEQGAALDHFWTAVWTIPTSYPSGSLGYKVVATGKDDQSQTWEPFKSKPSQLTVVDGQIEIKKP